MLTERAENLLSKTVSRGGFLIGILVFTGLSNDPVNLPKLILLAPVAGICMGTWIYQIKTVLREYKFLFLIFGLFISALILNLFTSSNPTDLTIYGGFGRNTGVLSYFSLAIIAFSSMLLSSNHNYERIIKALILVGFVNIIYSVFVIVFQRDPIPWNNPNLNLFGTFGNQNFISSFSGIAFSVCLAIAVSPKVHKQTRLILLFMLPFYLLVIFRSRSLQGVILVIIGLAFVLFLLIRDKFNKNIQKTFASFISIGFVLGILGMLQIGPLSSFIYKPTISIRGEYWAAGFKMFQQSPVFGLGLDSYAQHYREVRRVSALILPGVDTATDASHNVFLDLLAGGGLVLFVPYVILVLMAIRLSFQYIKDNSKYDYIFVALFVGFITYISQTLISINQIGLAIWGWVLMGALIGYTSHRLKEIKQTSMNNVDIKSNQKTLSAGNLLVILVSFSLSLATVAPLISSDNSWKHEIKYGQTVDIVDATNQWPTNIQRYLLTIQILSQVKLNKEALLVAKEATKFDPKSYEAWNAVFKLTQDPKEKQTALRALHRLDPLNPAFQ